MFRLFADLIGIHLDTARRLVTVDASLLDAQAATELREQFAAVLGHDLRNPLASILTGTALLRTTPLEDKAQTVVGRMEKSARRMSALIDDVMDLARVRLGEGITLMHSDETLEPTLRQVIDELRAAHPNRMVEADFAMSRPVHGDRERIARLLSNLLGNALAYSPPDTPVRVSARTTDTFELIVTNHGPTIPSATRERLFALRARRESFGPEGPGSRALYRCPDRIRPWRIGRRRVSRRRNALHLSHDAAKLTSALVGMGVPVAPAHIGEAAKVSAERTAGLLLMDRDALLRLRDLAPELVDCLLGLADLVIADREARNLESLQHGAVLLELRPMPGDLAVAVSHRNAPDSFRPYHSGAIARI
jgi:hypothetical protein